MYEGTSGPSLPYLLFLTEEGFLPKVPPQSEAAHCVVCLLSNRSRKLVLGRGGWVDQIKTKKCGFLIAIINFTM